MDLIIRVNYGHDWISGNYEVGHTVWLTVTESDSITVKGTAQLETGYPPDWNNPGFSTDQSDWDGGQAPDIQPGDWVFGYVDTGYSTKVRVGTIDGNVDVDNDLITGTITAEWLGQAIDGDCQPWGSEGSADEKWFNGLDPDGVDVYSCSWGGEWDVQPGLDIAVEYYEPDGDSVMNVFYEPMAYLLINKRADASPGADGNFLFTIEYRNDGEANAENVVISDTMISGMSYISDTFGSPPTGTDPYVWDVGTLEPGDWIQFDLLVEITGGVGEWFTNTVEIGTTSFDQGEPEEKVSTWSTQIESNTTDLVIHKWPLTDDPAPGEEFIWQINACNNGGTGSSTVTLTDTLPISTTLQGWQQNGSGWVEESKDSEELVLSRSLIQGNGTCESVYLILQVDSSAEPGQEIENKAEIFSSNDTDLENNDVESIVHVGEPHTNLSVNKWWNWGQLVQGGMGSYGIDVRNNGNTGVDSITLTDTLPVDSSLIGVWEYDRNWNQLGEVTPIVDDGTYVAWDVDPLIPGDWRNYEIQIQFDSGIIVGTVISNSVVVEHQPDEDRYDDNYAERVDEIFDHGSNLRIIKYGDWEDHAGGVPVGAYQLTVENVGDEAIGPVVISDTYPSELPLDIDSLWSPYQDSGRDFSRTDHPSQNYFTVTMQELDPHSQNHDR